MRKLAVFLLRIISKLILKKYQPLVVGITGSVGKTSAKEAIYSVLSSRNQVRRNTKNYNNEFGVPLTIIGIDSPGRNIFGWLAVFFQSFYLLSRKSKKYPEVLVLEMGADHPGDIKYLTELVKLNVGVLTAIAPVHLEYFKNIANVIKEKQIIIEILPSGGFAVINGDDLLLKQTFSRTRAKIISFGLNPDNTVWASEFRLSTGREGEGKIEGISFKLFHTGHSVPVFLPGVLGKHQVYSALAAAAVGVAFDINLLEIAEALKTFSSPKGRMNLIHGIKKSLIIDDSYNSSPAASQAALEVLQEMPVSSKARRIAVFGEMLELGSYTEQGHREVGHSASELNIDFIVNVGEKTRDVGRGAKEAGMGEERIYYFDDNKKASEFLKQLIKQGDIILVKGSQSSRMEQIVKALMAHPNLARQLLVRQESPWVD